MKQFIALLLSAALWSCSPQDPQIAEKHPGNTLGINWSWVTPFGQEIIHNGITRYEGNRVWDIEELDINKVIYASWNSGLYLAEASSSPVPVSISYDWKQNNFVCVKKGLNADHCYAGGSSLNGTEPLLYVSDPNITTPLVSGWHNINLSSISGGATPKKVNNIHVDSVNKVIYLATDSGLMASKIPEDLSSTGYNFYCAKIRLASGIVSSKTYPVYSIAASSRGLSIGGDFRIDTAVSLLTLATPDPDNLEDMEMVPAASGLSDRERFRAARTFVASCRNRNNFVYAALSDRGGRMYKLLKSIDGGETYNEVNVNAREINTADPANPYFGLGRAQGNVSNGAIGVHPDNPEIISVGWILGPYISKDGGRNLNIVRTHDDITQLKFSRYSPSRLWVTNHGGVFILESKQPVFPEPVSFETVNINTYHNRFRPGLQTENMMYGFYGRLGVKELITPGTPPKEIVMSGFFDNGVAYSIDGESKWRNVFGGDGSLSNLNHFPLCFVSEAGETNEINAVKVPGRASLVRITIPGPQSAVPARAPLIPMACLKATVRIGRDKLFWGGAISFRDVDGSGNIVRFPIYGIYSNADSTNIRAEYLTSINLPVGENFTVAEAVTQNALFFATNRGRIFKIECADIINPVVTVVADFYPVPEAGVTNFYVQKIEINEVNNRITALVDKSYRSGPRQTVLLDMNNGTLNNLTGTLSNEVIYSFANYQNSTGSFVFVCTAQKVLIRNTRNTEWTDVSYNLPRVPWGSDLQVLKKQDGTTGLFLATFAWGVFRTPVTF